MKTLVLGLSVLLLAACSSTAPSHAQNRGQVVSVVGTVMQTEEAPLVCGAERERSSSGTNPLLAAVVGGVIGNQFGGGSGRKWATAAGAGVGYGVARNGNKPNATGRQDCRRDGYLSRIRYINPHSGNMEYSDIHTNETLRAGQRIRTSVRVFN